MDELSTEEKVFNQVEEYLKEVSPTDPLSHAESFGYLKGLLGDKITQEKYAAQTKMSSKSLRNYIKDNRDAFDRELQIGMNLAEDDGIDKDLLSDRSLSDDQIDRFIEVLYESAITGNNRDRQLLINFTGMSAADVMQFNKNKTTTLKWWIKSNLNNIMDKVDLKDMAIHLNESEVIDTGDKRSKSAAQTFVNKSIEDDPFKLELMYFGMLFVSMYTQQQHPDMPVLSAAVRIQRLEDGTAQPINKGLVKKYAAGKAISKEDKAVNMDQLKNSLLEVFPPDKVKEIMDQLEASKNKVSPPANINQALVRERETELSDELEVLVSFEEELRKLFSKNLRDSSNK